MSDDTDLLLNTKLKEDEPAELLNPLGISAMTYEKGHYLIELDMIYQKGRMYTCVVMLPKRWIKKFLSFFDSDEDDELRVANIIDTDIRLVLEPPIKPKWKPLTLKGRTKLASFGILKIPIPFIEETVVEGEGASYKMDMKPKKKEVETDDTDEGSDQ